MDDNWQLSSPTRRGIPGPCDFMPLQQTLANLRQLFLPRLDRLTDFRRLWHAQPLPAVL